MPAVDAAGGPEGQGGHAASQHSLAALPVPVRELIAGGLSGGFSKTCVAPLERCKILFQTGRLHPGSVIKTLQNIFVNEGVQGLFRGNGASVLRIVPYSALYMGCYERYRRALVDVHFMAGAVPHGSGRVSPVVDLVAGSSAGATAVVFTYPLDLVRTRLAFMTEARPGAAAATASTNVAAEAGTAATAAGAPRGTQCSRGAGHRTCGGSSSSAGPGGGGYHRHASQRLPLPAFSGSFAAAPRGLTLGMSNMAAVNAALVAPSAVRVAARHSAAGSHCAPSTAATASAAALRAGLPRAPAAAAAVAPASPAAVPLFTTATTPNTILGVLSSTLRQEGVRGMYHGIGPSLYGILPYAGLKFYMYQHLKGRFHSLFPERMTGARSNRLPVPVMLTYGAVAGLVAQTATYPLDVVRRRMQVEGLMHKAAAAQEAGISPARQQFVFRSTPQALVAIARQEGWRSLFAGLSINYMKVVPSTAIGFTIYDYMKSHLDLSTNL